MKWIAAASIAVCSTSSAFAQVAARPPAPIVFFDIAGPDDAKQTAFYARVFGWTAGAGGVMSVPVSGPMLKGTLRADPAAKVIYIGVPDIAVMLRDVAAAGGKTVMPRFEVKGVAVIALFDDPAGNTMGLVELGADGKPKLP